MKRIFKYKVEMTDVQSIELPEGAEILQVGEGIPSVIGQPGCLVFWAIVDTDAPLELRHFCVYGTGHAVASRVGKSNHIGTATCGPYVWHVFEVDL